MAVFFYRYLEKRWRIQHPPGALAQEPVTSPQAKEQLKSTPHAPQRAEDAASHAKSAHHLSLQHIPSHDKINKIESIQTMYFGRDFL